jgi:branched-chain amino acid transport system substrate-binding protein
MQKRQISRLGTILVIWVMSLFYSFPEISLAQTSGPIALGAAVSLTGNLARSGLDQKMGYELWVDHINVKGGLLGRKVQLKIYDDRSDPMTGARLYEKLITSDKVDLLIGPYGSSVTAAVSTVVEKHKMVMIAPGASSKEIWERGYKYVFQMITPARYQLSSAVEIAKARGYKTFAVINADSAFPRDLVNGALKDIKETGLTLLLHEEYPEGANDLSSLILKTKAAGPDVLIAGSYLPDGVLLVRQSKEANLVPKMFQFGPVGPSIPDFVKSLGSTANGLIGVSQWEPSVKYPGSPELVAAFKKKFSNESPDYSMAAAYSSCELMGIAVEKVGSLNQEKIRQAILSMDLMTPFGRFKVGPSGDQVGHKTVLVQILNGQRVVVWPGDAAVQKIVLPFPGWQ